MAKKSAKKATRKRGKTSKRSGKKGAAEAKQTSTSQNRGEAVEDDRSGSPPAETPADGNAKPSDDGAFPVVGIGASAGGLEAFKRLLHASASNSGMAFVLIQHLDPNHQSLMADLLSRYTDMLVVEAADAMPLEPNRVYMIPPNKYLKVHDGGLFLDDPVKRRGMRMPIDYFFRSLAEVRREKAIGVILSGTGTDGTLGAKEIKGAGGMVMVQEPDSAQYDGMPRSAISTGIVDYVLPIERMPETLIRYVEHPYVGGFDDNQAESYEPDTLRSILALLRAHTDYDFRCYKRGTLVRRIQRRMGLRHVRTFEDYLQLARQEPEEIRNLFGDLLIGVTRFFRDPEAWEALAGEAARIVSTKDADEPVRIWAPGCSTGEEAYSLAIVFIEEMERQGKRLNLQIFATDLDERAIEAGRNGVYPASIASDVSQERLKKYFIEQGEHYRVVNRLRESTLFAVQNLIGDPPFSKLDCISCRNLLIYLGSTVQEGLIQMFHFALREGGVLFLGSSESIGSNSSLFEPKSKKWRLYERNNAAQRTDGFPIAPARSGSRNRGQDEQEERAELAAAPGATTNVVDAARRALLQRYAPAAAVINHANEAIYFHGPIGQYLTFPEGRPTSRLPALVSEPLGSKLRALIKRCRASGQRAVAVSTSRTDGETIIEISVEPFARDQDGQLLVAFREIQPAPSEETVADDNVSTATPGEDDPGAEITDELDGMSRLEFELHSTREDLQSTIEELETSNEELRASNEEVMSMNEELQSANEELETSREELQSLNEELTTVNSQLEEKVRELEQTNNDLHNLLVSTDIATIFLDTDLRIRRFTPATGDLFRLIDGDIGRPISDLSSRVEDKSMLEDAQHVLKRLVLAEKEVRNQDGKTFMRRIQPYRTSDNAIKGVVITFTHISRIVEARDRLRSRERQQAAVAALGQAALGGSDVSAILEEALQRLASTLGVDAAEIFEYVPEEKALRLQAGLGWEGDHQPGDSVSVGRDSPVGYTFTKRLPVASEHVSADERFSGARWLKEHGVASCVAAPIGAPEQLWGVLAAYTRKPRVFSDDDVNFLQSLAHVVVQAVQRNRAEEALRRTAETLERSQEAGKVGTWVWDVQNDIVQRSPELLRMCGPPIGRDTSSETWFEMVHPDDRPQLEQAIEEALSGGGTFDADFRFVRSDGEELWLSGKGEVEFEGGKPVRMLGINIDITARKRAEQAARESATRLHRSLAELEAIYRSTPAGLCVFDCKRRLIRVNDQMAKALWNAEASKRLAGEAELPGWFREAVDSWIDEVLSSGRPVMGRKLSVPAGQRPERVWLGSCLPIADETGDVDLVACVLQEVTELHQVQAELERSRGELQELTTRLIEMQEESYRKLAQELHDVFGQHLAVLAMRIGELGKKLPRKSEEFEGQAAEARQDVERLSREIHELARQLHPAILDDLGLTAAIKELCESFSNNHDISAGFSSNISKRKLPKEMQLCLYRVTQECLTNVSKHSGASSVEISLRAHEGEVTLRIADDGKGFDPKRAHGGGLGLLGMRERMRQIGGSLTLRSARGEGTEVEARAPLAET